MRTVAVIASAVSMMLTACGTSVVPSVDGDIRPTATLLAAVGHPELEPTADPFVTLPQSIRDQMSVLERSGYSVKESQAGWELVSKENQTVLTTPEPGTVIINTKDGGILTYPQEAFEVKSSIGAGVEVILTVKNTQGKVEYFSLDKEGYWVSPIELQTNPEVIENYTPIELEDMWSGRVLYSELLAAEPFPSGTAVPDDLIYRLWPNPKGEIIDLIALFKDSQFAETQPAYQEMVNVRNDYRRWIAFYKTNTPSGLEMIVGTQQMLSPDGKTSYLFHYGTGEEWPQDKDSRTFSGDLINIVDNIYRASEQGPGGNDLLLWTMNPTIAIKAINPQAEETYFGLVRPGGHLPPTAGIELYKLEQNNPLSTSNELAKLVEEAFNNSDLNVGGNLSVADEKTTEQLQYMFLLGNPHGFQKNYFP